VTTLPRAEGTGALRAPVAGTVGGYPGPPLTRPHILVVNGRKVRHPVFVIGAPRAGPEMLARAFKRTPGFHMTLGQRWVLPVVQAFARTPSLARGRPEAAATVLRDAFAQGWQISPGCCLGCTLACREAAGTPGTGPWFRPGFVNLDAEITHPLLGLDSPPDRGQWTDASVAGKCAMRWRGTVRLMARLRMRLSAEQLITLRYEDMVRRPAAAASALATFTGFEAAPVDTHVAGTVLEPGAWRRVLTTAQVAEVEQVAGEELRRVGYGA